MAHIPIPDCWRVNVLFGHITISVKAEMTFGLYDPSGVIAADPGTFANDVWLKVVADLAPALDTAVSLNGVGLEDVRTVPYGGAIYPQTPVVGTRSYGATGAPTDMCIAVKRSTSALGRSGRGRLFWPLWEAGAMATIDAISSATSGVITAALSLFQADVESLGTGLEMSVLSTVHGGAPRTSGVHNQITAWSTTDLFVDSQRRRLLGRGP